MYDSPCQENTARYDAVFPVDSVSRLPSWSCIANSCDCITADHLKAVIKRQRDALMKCSDILDLISRHLYDASEGRVRVTSPLGELTHSGLTQGCKCNYDFWEYLRYILSMCHEGLSAIDSNSLK